MYRLHLTILQKRKPLGNNRLSPNNIPVFCFLENGQRARENTVCFICLIAIITVMIEGLNASSSQYLKITIQLRVCPYRIGSYFHILVRYFLFAFFFFWFMVSSITCNILGIFIKYSAKVAIL